MHIVLIVLCVVLITASGAMWYNILADQFGSQKVNRSTVVLDSPDENWRVVLKVTYLKPEEHMLAQPNDNCSIYISYMRRTDAQSKSFGTTYLNTGLFFTEDNYTAVWRSNCLELTLKGQGQPPKVYRIPLNKEG